MNLTTLTNSSLINLQTTFESRDQAIEVLAEQLNQQGKLHNKEEYLKAVFEREAHGATALGEGLAHCYPKCRTRIYSHAVIN